MYPEHWFRLLTFLGFANVLSLMFARLSKLSFGFRSRAGMTSKDVISLVLHIDN